MESNSSELPLWLLALFPIWFAAVWCLVCIVVSRWSGWHALERRFMAAPAQHEGIRSAGPMFYTVYMRLWCHYSSVIRMVATEDALYLSVLILFRIGHAPLCIPWNEIEASQTKIFWRRYLQLTLGREEQIPMRISERMARQLGIYERLLPDANIAH